MLPFYLLLSVKLKRKTMVVCVCACCDLLLLCVLLAIKNACGLYKKRLFVMLQQKKKKELNRWL